jgi:hypothetical protein
MLFEDRLDMELYRPIGMEWFDEGFWGINRDIKTAEQFLGLHQGYYPADGTPRLNVIMKDVYRIGEDSDFERADTVFVVEPGRVSYHKAARLRFFKENKFDYVVASIPEHVPIFQELIRRYNPQAKLIIQMGNNWNIDLFPSLPVLASIAPQLTAANAFYYHQEFDLEIFKPSPVPTEKKIYSFVNVLKNLRQGALDYDGMRRVLNDFEWKSFGGQNADGSTEGPLETAQRMSEAMFIFHSKDGGDGFGHVIHNAYAIGRPVIIRSSQYRGQLAEQLFAPGTFIDMDQYSRGEIKNMVRRLSYDPEKLNEMGQKAAEQFRQVVNYKKESEEIAQWLKSI